MNQAELSVDLHDEAVAHAVHQALLPEAAEGPEGSSTDLRRDGSVVHATLEAADVSTLRAALNSVLRLLDAAQRTVAAAD